MKHTSNVVIMGFLIVGLWYAVGYLQGQDQSSYREFQRGKEQGMRESSISPDDDQG